MHTANKSAKKCICITFILPYSSLQRVRRISQTVDVNPENTSLSPNAEIILARVVDGGPALTRAIALRNVFNSELRTQNHLFASFTSTIQSDSYTQMINDVKGMETCIKISNFDRYHASHQI